ncbi:MAG: type II toxin-antitoxin system VapC family toxin [Chloroflexi bacterium]|nr:type II toxin-antitoxin system VapC family toxin [Chloroflexota bacterium]
MPGSVVDASVMAAWCFREPRADEAFGLIDGVELHAPGLLRYELTNVARKKAIDRPGLVDSLKVSLGTALDLPIRWHDLDHSAVLELAIESGLTAYDASYLHLSRSLALPLLTFDDRLRETTAPPRPASPDV